MQGLIANYQFENENPPITFNYTGTITRDSQNRFWKSSGVTGWDAQVYSSEGYIDGCYLSWRQGNVATRYMMGLSANPTSSASHTFEYKWYQDVGGDNSVYEGATGYGGHVTFVVGDLLAISYWDGILTYWRNGAAFRSVNAGTGRKFYMDSSFSEVNATGYQIYNIYFGPSAPDFHIKTFYDTNTFYVPIGVTSVEALVVAGGGGGGMDMGGGGGAGGVIYNSAYAVTPGGSVPVTVGRGGCGAPAGSRGFRLDGAGPQPGSHQFTIPATSGANSTFGALTAIGGGFGGSSYRAYTPGIAGAAGGSGGGASGYNDNAGTFYGGAGTAGQGYAGGNTINAYYSGGGGGAGGAGAGSNNRANGGAGIQATSISAFYWGGGGGGAGYSSQGGDGGIGGGGAGAVAQGSTNYSGAGINTGINLTAGSINSQTNTPGADAGANTGGGGGGGSHYCVNNKGGEGGSGIVMIKYKKPIFDLAGINHGVAYGGLSFVSGPGNKKALSFNGTNQYVNTNMIIKAGDKSIFYWVSFNSLTTASGYQIMGVQQTTDKYAYLGIQNGGQLYGYMGNVGGTFAYTIPSAGIWYHLGFTMISGVIRVYVNGAYVDTKTSTSNTDSTIPFLIGALGSSPAYFLNGSIADVRIFNRALNTKEIATLYNMKPANVYIESNGAVNSSLLIEG